MEIIHSVPVDCVGFVKDQAVILVSKTRQILHHELERLTSAGPVDNKGVGAGTIWFHHLLLHQFRPWYQIRETRWGLGQRATAFRITRPEMLKWHFEYAYF